MCVYGRLKCKRERQRKQERMRGVSVIINSKIKKILVEVYQ